MKQAQLAKLSGIGQASISEIEKGETPKPGAATIAKLAEALQVRLEWLTAGKEPMKDPGPKTPPLPRDAELVARNWLMLTPEVRIRVAEMIEEMVKSSAADKEPAQDERVAHAYGKPGRKK